MWKLNDNDSIFSIRFAFGNEYVLNVLWVLLMRFIIMVWEGAEEGDLRQVHDGLSYYTLYCYSCLHICHITYFIDFKRAFKSPLCNNLFWHYKLWFSISRSEEILNYKSSKKFPPERIRKQPKKEKKLQIKWNISSRPQKISLSASSAPDFNDFCWFGPFLHFWDWLPENLCPETNNLYFMISCFPVFKVIANYYGWTWLIYNVYLSCVLTASIIDLIGEKYYQSNSFKQIFSLY